MAENHDLFSFQGLPGVAPMFTVSGFVSALNQSLVAAYPTVEIEGEVSSFNINQGKFVFFDLKDAESSVGCFMMAFALRTPLEDGMKVKVTATPKLTNKGRFSLTIKKIQLSGEGSLKRAYELLKAKLDEEGLFDSARKRPLPEFPVEVGVISSVDSAGYKDFQKISNELWGGVDFEVAHVQVQGEAAPEQILSAMEYFNTLSELPEVLVLLRGGGSLEDLSAFNDEAVARAVASSRVPVLVGVGHEVDVTLAGLAADLRASTPSNAAQLLLPSRRDILSRIDFQKSVFESSVTRLIDGLRKEQVLRIDNAMSHLLDTYAEKVSYLRKVLRGYDPREALKRGYSIARNQGSVLRSAAGLKPGDAVVLELSDANVNTEVKNVSKK